LPVRFESEQQGRLARIILDWPPLNILDLAHLLELEAAVHSAHDADVVVLEAAPHSRAFSAGNDVADHTPERAPRMLGRFHGAVRELRELEGVTVADVRGPALGGGCELVAACDLAYASEDATFGQPEIDVGCFPPVAAALLPARIGETRAAHLVLTGQPIDAATAAAWGLITAVGEPPIEALLAKSPAVLRIAKKALRADGLEAAELIYVDELLAHPDCAEGVQAFLEKRAPRWR
jgi:cyclohexa-1,5-dienecarbonyl-CoA hydratase